MTFRYAAPMAISPASSVNSFMTAAEKPITASDIRDVTSRDTFNPMPMTACTARRSPFPQYWAIISDAPLVTPQKNPVTQN